MNDRDLEVRGLVLDVVRTDETYYPTFAARLASAASSRGFGDDTLLDAVSELFREGHLAWGSSLTGVALGGVSMSTAPFFRITARGSKLLAAHRLQREQEARKGRELVWKKEQQRLSKEAAK